MINIIDFLWKPLQYTNTFGANDLIGWLLAASGGIFIYKAIDNFQTKMSRHTMLLEVEFKINEMLANNYAINTKNTIKMNKSMRTILDDEVHWIKLPTDRKLNDIEKRTFKGQRFILIRNLTNGSKDYISTKAIHEYVILFRRIEKLYKDKIIKKRDLSDVWREILPFSTSGRLEFFSSYLSKEDFDSMHYVIVMTINACQQYQNVESIRYLNKHLKKIDLCYYLGWNKRFRYRDFIKYIRSRKVLK